MASYALLQQQSPSLVHFSFPVVHSMTTVLMIEDTPPNAELYRAYLEKVGMEVEWVDTGRKAISALEGNSFDLLLLDLNLPDMDGLEVLSQLNEQGRHMPTIVLTGMGSVQRAVDAMREGAMDFLMKPCSAEKLQNSVNSALERWSPAKEAGVRESTPTRKGPSGFLGKSAAMRNVFSLIERAAGSSASVFITGESGTGKELCAQAIHNSSDRRNGPFIPLNCAAIPRELMESEIFGHRKGSFTGAFEDRIGAAEMANGGTLFLDEVCEMDPDLQAKLLRFLQTSSYKRVGDTVEKSTDIRFVCATNKDPLEQISKGEFREDLYYRLHVIPIEMPPLRERGSDVMMLAERFLHDMSGIEGKHFQSFDQATTYHFMHYPWAGNVRELENVIRNIVVLNDGDSVTMEMLPLPINRKSPTSTLNSALPENGNIADTTDFLIRPIVELEIMAIDAALDKFNGNVTKAARALDISPSTIYRKKSAWDAR